MDTFDCPTRTQSHQVLSAFRGICHVDPSSISSRNSLACNHTHSYKVSQRQPLASTEYHMAIWMKACRQEPNHTQYGLSKTLLVLCPCRCWSPRRTPSRCTDKGKRTFSHCKASSPDFLCPCKRLPPTFRGFTIVIGPKIWPQ